MKFALSILMFGILLHAEMAVAKDLCLGDKSAKNQWIYLHGMDEPEISPQERDNRALMERLSRTMNARIFVPRGNSICQGKICWRQNSPEEVKATFGEIRQAAKSCINPDKPFGFIGFSNGGYIASKIAHFCLAPKPAWIVAIGSAGQFSGEGNLTDCTPLSLLIGKHDMTREKAKRYFEALTKAKLKVTYKNFQGGHELIQPVLEDALKSWIN